MSRRTITAIGLLLTLAMFAVACGTADNDATLNPADYEIMGNGVAEQPTATPSPAPADAEPEATEARTVHILSESGEFASEDFETLPNFKLSKTYDVAGLKGAEAAIYGFFGPDPYDRQEYEVRIYPDHASTLTDGVDFANEATGPDAVLASATQRWDEGLTQRRACAANTRGSHHSGRCNIAKYGDYAIVGNLVLLCQGKDSQTALENCNMLYEALQ